jgi:hypothetical protein
MEWYGLALGDACDNLCFNNFFYNPWKFAQ